MTGDYHGDCALCTLLGGAILFLIQRFGWPWMLPLIEILLKPKAPAPEPVKPVSPVADLKPLADTQELPTTPPKEIL